ncbi:MAG: hypothetical protein ACLQUY_18580 [Ktedonobacterales bacterium]
MNTDHQSTTSGNQTGWPLPGTLRSGFRPSWTQWVVQLAEYTTANQGAVVRAAVRQDAMNTLQASNLAPSRRTSSCWPLPATYMPHFRLSWAQWTLKLHDDHTTKSQQSLVLADAA